ncbi:MAG: gamma-glutamyl-gamma-aminobutyrate hydrolase family protein [Algisphaera sp.]
MSSPRIGITLDNVANHASSGKYEVGLGYSRAVAAAGGTPLLLPHEPTLAAHYAKLCDGLLLTGGVDPNTTALPSHWPGHSPMHAQARVMDPQRQAFELALLAATDAHPTKKPVLGVCLGMQLMTLHCGGTLNQFLPDTHTPSVVDRHRDGDHTVTVTTSGVLGDAGDTGVIHSHHQQAVAHAGTLRVAATAEDDIIEAVDNPSRGFYVGVQWHPERGDAGPLSWGLIKRLVNASRPNQL